jgi:hypothetical protein
VQLIADPARVLQFFARLLAPVVIGQKDQRAKSDDASPGRRVIE